MRVRVTGFLDPDAGEIDDNDSTGLTEEAFLRYSERLSCLDDLEFLVVEDD